MLDQFVAEAQRANPNVRTAGLRIMEARAQLGIAGSTLYPQVQQATGDVLWAARAQARRTRHQRGALSAGFQVGWELDFWGKFRRGIEAADAGYFASIAQYDDLQVLMAAQVASFYCSIRTLEARLVIARENAALQKRSLEIAERLFKGGDESELDVQQAKAQYLGTLATIPALESALRQTQNALSTLLARAPGPVAGDGRRQGRHPAGRAGGHRRHAGRPAAPPSRHQGGGDADGRAVGADRRERGRPLSVDLAAGLGRRVGALAERIVAGADLGLGPSLVWNVFDHGRLTNAVLVQDARFQQLYEQYQDAVLRAAREVDDAAVGFAKTGEQILLLTDSVEAAHARWTSPPSSTAKGSPTSSACSTRSECFSASRTRSSPRAATSRRT